ncbi:Nramp family divalent metal transporter [Aureibaculum sp. A20]|uniref:Nramp family divalent metal transporter n=1 Tax=Aureibaculum flavum TaxID=2795986 RepID=A0ABS0WWI1_9FLAO|nr:Nramp family divalent metal transporter [Aureibaculum flavum]MBJ2176355.1 Nramp family divalent metal transporter [Aureibaculum flavum]
MNKSWLKKLGPGLLFAGAAIGVSHLVQSTRAGADFGFGLIWAILLVNLFKYPFFQYGPRYATATGESLIDGYKRLGKGVLIVYYILTLTTMFTIQAAVTIVTAGLAANLFGITTDVTVWSIIITLICLTTLLIGKYKLLDNLIKVIIVILTVSTLIAVGVAIFNTNNAVSFTQIIPKGALEISFLITFLGWMPAPLDISTWHSLWALEKQKDGVQSYNTKQSIFDFNIGYIGTTILAFCFLGLGALVMYQSGNKFSSSAGVFAQQIIGLYTETLGSQTAVFIGVAAFTTMLSTTLTTLDASPRAMERSSVLLFNNKTKLTYNFWIIILSAGTMIILFYFISNMITLVKIATILSFLTAPFYAIANFMLISGKHTPKEWRPSIGMKIVSYFGIVFLIGFSIWYLFNL